MRIHLHRDVDLAFTEKRVRRFSGPFRSDRAMTSSPLEHVMSTDDFRTTLTSADNTIVWATLIASCEPLPTPADEIVDATGLDDHPNVLLYEGNVQLSLASKFYAAFPYSANGTSRNRRKDDATNYAALKFSADCVVSFARELLNRKRDPLLGTIMRRNGAKIAQLHH